MTFRLSVDVCEFDPKDKSMMIEEITENEKTPSDGVSKHFLNSKRPDRDSNSGSPHY